MTIANGMIGLVSSPEPMKIGEVVLNGAFDTYGRGRVDNIMKGFNFMSINLDVDGPRVDAAHVSGLRQSLDMKRALLITEFDVKDKIHVRHSIAGLRQLPYTALATGEITALRDVTVTPSATIQASDILRDVKNPYARIDRPHACIPLMASVGKSPSGKHTVAAAVSLSSMRARSRIWCTRTPTTTPT